MHLRTLQQLARPKDHNALVALLHRGIKDHSMEKYKGRLKEKIQDKQEKEPQPANRINVQASTAR